jgi:hypothetical protein
MKSRVKIFCSAIVLATWVILVIYRSSLLLTGECNLGTPCMNQVELVLSLIAVYIGLELFIIPKSAAMFVLYNSILPDRMPLLFAR